MITERVGAVEFIDFKATDNKETCIMFFDTSSVALQGYTFVENALCVGRSSNTENAMNLSSPFGIHGPKSEYFSIHNSKFYNYDFNSAAALSDCAHCWHPASTDMGARTITTENLYFDEATVPRRIGYSYPFRGIFADMDGSLTGLGENTWATMDLSHNR